MAADDDDGSKRALYFFLKQNKTNISQNPQAKKGFCICRLRSVFTLRLTTKIASLLLNYSS